VRLGGGLGLDEDAYRFAFLALAVLLAVPAVEAIMLPRSAGNVVAGRA
jgi:hypothetical protein